MIEIRRHELGAMVMVLGHGVASVAVSGDRVLVTYVCRGEEQFYRKRLGLSADVDMTFTVELDRGPERDAVLRRVRA